eukprot:9650751-Lingulodinium_polyedra.AAC.1
MGLRGCGTGRGIPAAAAGGTTGCWGAMACECSRRCCSMRPSSPACARSVSWQAARCTSRLATRHFSIASTSRARAWQRARARSRASDAAAMRAASGLSCASSARSCSRSAL